MTNQPISTNHTQEKMRTVEALLKKSDSQPVITITKDGEHIEVPEPISTLVQQAIDYIAQGKQVHIFADDMYLTTQEAANLLGMSRQYIVSLTERGVIPYTKVGTHRRLKLSDVLEYKKQRDAERDKALQEMVKLSEEMHLYDEL